MRAELLLPQDPRWCTFLSRTRHDFYHLPEYAEMSAIAEQGQAFAVLIENRDSEMLLPVVVRAIPNTEGLRDAVSPYGYPGPIIAGRRIGSEDFMTEGLHAAVDLLRSESVVSLFVRLHPILSPMPRVVDRGAVVRHGETVWVDLRMSESEVWEETRPSHRGEIRRAVRAGYRAYVDEGFVHLDRFVEIYQATMRRVNADAYYLFTRDYVVALRSALGGSLRLVVVETAGRIAAAGLFVETCGIVEYHLSGSDPEFAKYSPTKLMLHFVREWGKSRGNSDLNLGGGLSGTEDSLFKFKAGFSRQRYPFFTARFVVNEDSYARLLLEGDASPTQPASCLTGFFPAYRRT